MTQLLAIYDMDKTITRAPTWTPFLAFAMRGRARWRMALLPAAGIAALAYAVRVIDHAQLKRATQRMMLGGALAGERLDMLTAAFADHVVATGILDGARRRIAADRAAGYRLVMATASYGFYAGAIAERLGFDAAIATEGARDPAGALVPRIVGENCYGPAKLRMIEAWLAREAIARSDAHVRFYSDHVSDAPSFAWADEPFAVNAHGPLRALARARGWPLLDWRI